MSASMRTPIAHDKRQRAWVAEDLAGDDRWIHRLSPDAISGFERALRHFKATGSSLLGMTHEAFPLEGAALEAVRQAVDRTQRDYGLCLMKGFPVSEWGEEDARRVFWGVGLYAGVARTQNKASDIISDVRDAGGEYRGFNGRGYNTNAALDFHCDFSDLVALLCLNPAKSGGESLVTSSMALHDEIGRRAPELLAVLDRPFYHSLQGGQAAGEAPYYGCPIFGARGGYFAARCNRKNITAAQERFPEVPRLTELQNRALDMIDELVASDELCYHMVLERGDLQLLNNHSTLHSRSAFQDFEEQAMKRHLLRLWLALPQAPALPEGWRNGYGATEAGVVRGGMRGSGITPEFLAYEARTIRWHEMTQDPRYQQAWVDG